MCRDVACSKGELLAAEEGPLKMEELCQFHWAGDGKCRYGFGCRFVHGDECPSCGLMALHPTDYPTR